MGARKDADCSTSSETARPMGDSTGLMTGESTWVYSCASAEPVLEYAVERVEAEDPLESAGGGNVDGSASCLRARRTTPRILILSSPAVVPLSSSSLQSRAWYANSCVSIAGMK